MSTRLHYDVIGASMHSNKAYREHPQKVMKDLGFKLIKSEPCMIADCWLFEVEDNNIELPPFLEEWNFKFNDELQINGGV